MKRTTFNQYIKELNFKGLFITEMGWNSFRGQADILPFDIDGIGFSMKTIAERNGFQVITASVESIPTTTVCRKIDYKLRQNAHDYICIFYIPNTEHHQWIAPIKTVEKRDIVTIEYETVDKADFLFSKIDSLSFDFDERTTIVDVKERIQGAFAINSEKITKDFYAGFKKEHKAFADFITGIDDDVDTKDNRNKQWYTSVMLNRLMFCYFIQKKGFLDGDFDYLPNKLRWVRKEQGENRFFQSFYRGFLSDLFHDGLNAPRHNDEFERKYGRIPYLNGGMFDEHQLEREYKDIDICDEAFIRLFNFFDTWRWHLDTRITASGKDINPDVLGYIFEQYINDRAQMGAYYTKEDITEYIGKNCIIPFLMDKTAEKSEKAFASEGFVWETLRNSGDKYVYDAVKKGYSEDWQQLIPENISVGIDTTQPNLLERRADWNTKTLEKFALPTEIWRETIERLQRCESILNKIRNGEITHINDFIAYNLDIRSFAYDLLRNTNDHLYVRHFYKSLQGVTILDPTCGSGAFLFAAMNILEPLYEVCIERMQEFNRENPLLFKAELEEISNRYRSNIQYFIFKSIILRNLYGVDIMVEATEIAKLRLFLKMVAVVEVDKRADNLGLDPLPDIDFNIRCGNTLVGYATEDELNNDLNFGADILQVIANKEFKEKVEQEMQLVSMAYDRFKLVQFTQEDDMVAFKQAKRDLKQRLCLLNELLNRRMNAATDLPYEQWLSSHQPFHWLAEFYQIIKGNGGFDIIIGNPPYVVYTDTNCVYKISDNYKTRDCSNLYAFCIERSLTLNYRKGRTSMIVPVAIVNGAKLTAIRSLFEKGIVYTVNFSGDTNPGVLFNGVRQNLTIFNFIHFDISQTYTTRYIRFFNIERANLFNNIYYHNSMCSSQSYVKIQSHCQQQIFNKVTSFHRISLSFSNDSKYHLYKKTTSGSQYKLFFKEPPYFSINGTLQIASSFKPIFFRTEIMAWIAVAIYNSNLFNIWWISYSDGRNVTSKETDTICVPESAWNDLNLKELANQLITDLNSKSERVVYNKQKGYTEYDLFKPRLSKHIIDSIDKILAKHYGFTEEELDFIINYDIKYRMGDELNE